MKFLNTFFSLLLITFFTACAGDTTSTAEEVNNVEAVTTENKAVAENTSSSKKRIVFFGNSLSAAYGLSNQAQGFVSLIQQKIDSLGLNYEVVNAGNSGETTAGGKGRIEWVLEQPVDIFVLELGGNDGLRGIDPKSSYKNLEYIIQQVQNKYPEATIILAGMEAPPNMGDAFTAEFRSMYPRLAKAYDTKLIPFLLDQVAGVASLNQADRIHPNVAGNKIMAETVWNVLKDEL